MDRIEKRLGLIFSLRRISLNNVLSEFGLIYEDFQIIRVLRYVDGASIEELKDKTNYDLKLVEIVIQNLLKKKLIIIQDQKICLTSKVKKLYPIIKRKIKEVDEKVIAEIPQEEVQQIIETLDKLIEYYDIEK